ncbi:hypothetical protein CEJ42_13030 [Herbaspirillum robiniae]|uniref:Uncharacterized protein n=1 Tax=Herbaspirillum robiniae TaxID=2014887 RepID=A0A246WR82_9BURK|nr:hypothetical protein CEJ42_13030 [Herbaspirillum robiniae]
MRANEAELLSSPPRRPRERGDAATFSTLSRHNQRHRIPAFAGMTDQVEMRLLTTRDEAKAVQK